MKTFTIVLNMFILWFLVFGLYTTTNQDCEKNPPSVIACSSTNLIDEGYTDCKLSQYEEKNLIFPDKEERYNCAYGDSRVDIPLIKTKCSKTPSNLTSDYRFCK